MQKKILYAALFIFSVWLFSRGIPLDIFHGYSITLTLIGGILCTFLLAITLFQFFPATPEESEKTGQNIGCALIAVVIIFFFGFSMFLLFDEIGRSDAEIDKNGVYTTGVIVDGSSYKTRKVDLTSVMIKFKTKDGKEQYTSQDISAQEFSRYSQFEEVPIVYSKRYPSILKILRTDAEIAKYSKSEVRDITLSDLIKLYELKTPIEINKYLNNINKEWDYQNGGDDQSVIYFNKFKKIAIKVIKDKDVIYMLNDVNQQLFEEEIPKLKFEKMDMGSGKGMVYTNGNFIISKRVERIKSSDPEAGPLDFRHATVVEVVKMK